jgi:predicted enzyme related to lactoylglutathione lyase
VAINLAFAGIPVADYAAALPWYERLFGRPPDVIVSDTEAMWQVTTAAWVYVVRDAERAGRALLTLLVDDLDEHLAALAAGGFVSGPVQVFPGGARKAVLVDPEGNSIGFGAVPRTAD